MIEMELITSPDDYVITYFYTKNYFVISSHQSNKKFRKKFNGSALIEKFNSFKNGPFSLILDETRGKKKKKKKSSTFQLRDQAQLCPNSRERMKKDVYQMIDNLTKVQFSAIFYYQIEVALHQIAVVDWENKTFYEFTFN